MIEQIWIQAHMTKDGTAELLVAPGVADKIKSVDVYEIGSPAVKCTFEEESHDPHMET